MVGAGQDGRARAHGRESVTDEHVVDGCQRERQPAKAPDRPGRLPSRPRLLGGIALPNQASVALHEKFGFTVEDLKPLPYDGPRGIRAMLEGLANFGWERIEENDRLIALVRGQGSVTLEPAGQLELSGAPLASIQRGRCGWTRLRALSSGA